MEVGNNMTCSGSSSDSSCEPATNSTSFHLFLKHYTSTVAAWPAATPPAQYSFRHTPTTTTQNPTRLQTLAQVSPNTSAVTPHPAYPKQRRCLFLPPTITQ
jgi:hypothetical protein